MEIKPGKHLIIKAHKMKLRILIIFVLVFEGFSFCNAQKMKITETQISRQWFYIPAIQKDSELVFQKYIGKRDTLNTYVVYDFKNDGNIVAAAYTSPADLRKIVMGGIPCGNGIPLTVKHTWNLSGNKLTLLEIKEMIDNPEYYSTITNVYEIVKVSKTEMALKFISSIVEHVS